MIFPALTPKTPIMNGRKHFFIYTGAIYGVNNAILCILKMSVLTPEIKIKKKNKWYGQTSYVKIETMNGVNI